MMFKPNKWIFSFFIIIFIIINFFLINYFMIFFKFYSKINLYYYKW